MSSISRSTAGRLLRYRRRCTASHRPGRALRPGRPGLFSGATSSSPPSTMAKPSSSRMLDTRASLPRTPQMEPRCEATITPWPGDCLAARDRRIGRSAVTTIEGQDRSTTQRKGQSADRPRDRTPVATAAPARHRLAQVQVAPATLAMVSSVKVQRIVTPSAQPGHVARRSQSTAWTRSRRSGTFGQ